MKERHIAKSLLYLIKSSLLKEWRGELRKATRNRKTKKLEKLKKKQKNLEKIEQIQ